MTPCHNLWQKCSLRYDLRSNNKNFALEKPETNFMKKSIRYTQPHSYGTAYIRYTQPHSYGTGIQHISKSSVELLLMYPWIVKRAKASHFKKWIPFLLCLIALFFNSF